MPALLIFLKNCMRKILFAINNFGIGGAERLVVDQINAIDRSKFEPYVLTLLPEPEQSIRTEINLPPERLWHVPVTSVLNIGAMFNIKRLMKAHNIHIVITNLFLANLFVRKAAILAGVKHIYAYEHSMYRDKRLWQKIADKMLARYTKKIFVGARDVKEFTAAQEGIPSEKFVVNYNAADFKKLILNADEGSAVRVRFGVPQDAMLFVAAGRLIEQKGHRYLIKAMERIPAAHCLIFGQGILKQKLQELIDEKGLSGRVKLAGIAPISHIFAAGNVFVMPSLWEGLSVALVQAMAAGLPIVATNVSGTNEAIKNRKNGLLVPPGDIVALTSALQELSNDAPLRSRLGEAAKASSKQFSIEENIKRLEQVMYTETV